MKAAFYETYGSPDNIRLTEVAIPVPKDHEVCVRIHAASINSWDWDLLKGKPFLVRMGGWRKPRYNVLGADISGTVEQVGKHVRLFQAGDEVFGDISEYGWGGFAEYTCVSEKALVFKPHQISHILAASAPQAAVLALQALKYGRPMKAGDSVLINGGGGGVGTFAIQLAKIQGAVVTAVDRADKFDTMKQAGADAVIDYTTDPISNMQFDRIISVAGNRSLRSFRKMLRKTGVFVMVGGSMNRIFQAMIAGPFISLGSKKMGPLFWRPRIDDQIRIRDLIQSGRLNPIIDRTYPLEQIGEALSYIGEGNARGKVVIRVK